MKPVPHLLLPAVVTCLLSFDVSAQGIRATIVGRVTDERSAVVQHAKITVINAGTNESRVVESGETGDYTLPQLAPGEYTLTVEMIGFKKEVVRAIVLETNQLARVDVVFKVGTVAEEVEVVTATPLISSENAALGNVVDQKKIVELPLNGRDYLQLVFLQPNVFATAQNSSTSSRGGFIVAGNSEIANYYIKDGIDNNYETTNGVLHRPILDAVREFKVLTGTYSAEYGRQAGGQIIVTTRSGTNQFRGSLFEFHRNSVLDARNFFAPEKPSFRMNQFGGVIGGPIWRDRTFFFSGYEGQRRGDQTAALSTLPTSAMKLGDFSALATPIRNPFNNNQPFPGNQIPQSLWSKQGAGMLALFPDPNRAGSQNFGSAGTGRFRADQFSGRIDHRIGDSGSLFGVYEFADSKQLFPISAVGCGGRVVPGWGCDALERTQHLALGWTHIFGPRLVNEARVGYIRRGFYRLQEDRDKDVINRLGIGGLTDVGRTPFNNGAPEIRVTGYAIIGGPTNLPQGSHYNTYHYVEGMTLVLGKHTMRLGFDLANHANFYLPDPSAASSSFGTISQAAFQSQTGAQRQIQFALKLSF